ncbi:hypothetical protein D3C78_1970220 [compost metagenome]
MSSTLAVGLIPAVPLLVPPASTATMLTRLASGVSLRPWMVMVRVAVLVAPARSRMV